MRHEPRRQNDLFELQEIAPPLQPTLQAKLAPLLQALLMEAAGFPGLVNGSGEVGDDQDHD